MADILNTQMGGLPLSQRASIIPGSDTAKKETNPEVQADLALDQIDQERNKLLSGIEQGALAKGELKELERQKELEEKQTYLSGQERALQKQRESIENSEVQKQLNDVIERRNKTFVPTQETQKDLTNLFTLTTIIGFALGGAGKAHAQQAISAMNGMLEGHLKGRDDLYKREKDIFDENSKALDRIINVLQTQKRDTMELAKIDYEAAMAKVQQDAIAAGAPMLAKIAEKEGLVAYGEVADVLLKKIEAHQTIIMRMQDAAARRKEAEKRDAEIAWFHQQEIQNARDRMALQGQINEAKREKITPFIGLEVDKHYPTVDRSTLAGLSEKQADQVIGAISSIKESQDVVDYIKTNPNAVGAAAKLRNIINLDAIKSISGDAETVASAKADIIDRQIDDAVAKGRLTADDAAAAKVLNKKLFALALSDVRASGQRGSIYLDKSFKDIYDQSSRLGTLIQILHSRQQAANSVLEQINLNFEKRNDKDKYDLLINGPQQWLQSNFPVYTPKQIEEMKRTGQTPRSKYFMGTNGKLMYFDSKGKLIDPSS